MYCFKYKLPRLDSNQRLQQSKCCALPLGDWEIPVSSTLATDHCNVKKKGGFLLPNKETNQISESVICKYHVLFLYINYTPYSLFCQYLFYIMYCFFFLKSSFPLEHLNHTTYKNICQHFFLKKYIMYCFARLKTLF